MIDTGIEIQLPKNHYAQIHSRSGLSYKNGLEVGAGIIDEDYQGIIKIILYNHSKNCFHIKKGYKIAQLIVKQSLNVQFEETLYVKTTTTTRGNKGFGSSGL